MPQPTTRVRPTGCPGYSQTLPREPESVGTARRLVRVTLAAWRLDDLADDGMLIVSELASNAVRHARSRSMRVTITRPEAVLVRIGVVDRSRCSPEFREPHEEAETGRGLALVEGLASDWGVDQLRWGKRVWAELRAKERS
ncbi:ATP-binding protein [Streptomyces sp. NPDC007984]|uniref:ATP-binding protein n=1 Tax=Streptomyces sp. NPDC007984 TaxID=3364801 RepID=UPI0036E41A02